MSLTTGKKARLSRSCAVTTPTIYKSMLILGLCSLAVTFFLFQSIEETSAVFHPLRTTIEGYSMTQHMRTTQDSATEATDPKHGKEHLIEILDTMNYTHMVDTETWKEIPTWTTITDLYGDAPIVVGLERCQEFRDKVPEEKRLIGPAGLFNTGTNLLAELLKLNCQIPGRVKKMGKKRGHGMLWQAPWGKHTILELSNHTIDSPEYSNIDKYNVLPVVSIREPYDWFRSMCHNNYNVRWPHQHRCPNLIYPNQTLVTVMMQYFRGSIKQYHKSLAHVWNDWNRQYLAENLARPRLMVRHKDLIFFPRQVTQLVCNCAGGEMNPDGPFQYVMDSAVPSRKGHRPFDGLLGNWKKYGKEFRFDQFPQEDVRVAEEVLDKRIMNLFGFKGPP